MKLSNPFQDEALTITYSGALKLKGAELSTLAAYYDKIYLPYPYNWDPNAEVIFPPIGDQPALREVLEHLQETYLNWKTDNQLLFDAGVLKILPPPYKQDGPRPVGLAEALTVLTDANEVGTVSSMAVGGGVAALAVHFLIAEKPGTEIFVAGDLSDTDSPDFDFVCRQFVGEWSSRLGTKSNRPKSTSDLAVALIETLMHVSGPSLPEMNAEQTMEIRRRLEPYKRGFVDYVLSLTNDVERAMGQARTAQEAAQIIVERKIIPEANEFFRNYETSLKAILRASIGEGAGFFKVIAAASTRGVWAAVVESIFKVGVSIGKGVRDRRQALGKNSSHAFIYLGALSAACEDAETRLVPPPPPDLFGLTGPLS